jgi:hypothetical protein
MNERALKKVKKKHSAWIRYLNTKDGQDYQYYIRKRNDAQHAIRKARRQFEKDLAKDCKKNNKAVWNYVNSRKTRTGIAQLKKKDGKLTQNDQEAAEVLSDQYYATFTKEDLQNIPNIDNKELETPPLTEFQVTREKVLKLLRNLKTDKSPGLDAMHPRILKELAETISTPLTYIFQKSVSSGQLPRQWKDAVISPIYKKGDRKQAQNYRPVSLTSIICKLLERLVVDQIREHLENNYLASKEQHGFTTGKSTVTNLLEAMNLWTETLMHGTPVDILYLDYAKAFDTVPHVRLLRQVESFGIKGQALDWITSFLTGRRQKVRVNKDESQWKTVDSGVPQGSVLGPTLFAIFIADVPLEVSTHVSLFADDTKVYSAVPDRSSSNQLNTDLQKLHQWSQKMQMKFHPDKCKVMHLGNKNQKAPYTLPNEGVTHTLAEATTEKDLGVTIDNQLRFSDHVDSCVSKANRVLGCLRHTFKHLNKDAFLQLYKALVRPHLEYASCVWSPQLKKDQDAIERVQRRATKLVKGLRELPYDERLRELGLPSLKFRRRRADLIQTYKIIHCKDKLEQTTRCQKCPNKVMFQHCASTTRGHSLKLYKQEATGLRANFFSSRVLNDWNSLSEVTVTAPSVNHFKSALRSDWSNHPDLYSYQFSK